MTRRRTILASAIFAGLAIVVAGRPADAASECPEIYMFESSNGHDYVAVFSAVKLQRASFAVTVFGKARAYEFTVNDIAIDRPTTVKYAPYRSAPTLVENPDDGPLVADTVDVIAAATPGCPAGREQIPDVDSVVHPRRAHEPEIAAALHDIVAETAALTTVVNPVLRPDLVVPQCAAPFSETRTLRVETPVYPDIARNQNAIGSTRVKVVLSDTGAVTDATVFASSGNPALDVAAVKAARDTTYQPGTFLCKPYGGTYIFNANFSPR